MRDHGAFGFFYESQAAFGVQIDADEISEADLIGRDQVRHREYQMAFDGALQVTGAVARVGAFVQQDSSSLCRVQVNTNWLAAEAIKTRCWTMPSSISRICCRCSGAQGLEDHDLVDTVHELGRELAARGFDGGAVDFVVEALIDHLDLGSETESAFDEAAHLAGAQV